MEVKKFTELDRDGYLLSTRIDAAEILGNKEMQVAMLKKISDGIVETCIEKIMEDKFPEIWAQINMRAITNLVMQGVALEIQKKVQK